MSGGTPLGNMVIQLGIDSTKMENGLIRTQNQLKNFEKQVRSQAGIAKFYKKGEEAAKAYARQQDTLKKAIETQNVALKQLQEKYVTNAAGLKKSSVRTMQLGQEMEKTKKALDESIGKTGQHSEASIKLTEKLHKLQQEFDETATSTEKLDKSTQRLVGQIEDGNARLVRFTTQLKETAREGYLASSKLNALGERFNDFGDKVQKFGSYFDSLSQKTKGMSLAIFGGMTLAGKAAMDFESAFAGVRKTVDEVVDSNGRVTYSYEKLSDGIRQMANRLPASAAEIAKVAEAAGQLGIKTENVLDFTEVMIAMGESTNLSAEEAAIALAKFQNITQMSHGDFERLGSSIVELGNNMATTEQDIVNMGLRLASTGKLVGLSESQIMALAATLSSVGMEAEAGGSAMSRVMQKMNTAVAEGGETLQQFAMNSADSLGNLGMSAEQFADLWRKSPTEAITAFLKGLGKISDAGGDVTKTLKDIGINSIREIDSLQRLAGAGDLLTEALEMSGQAWKENSALSQEAAKRYETNESKLKIFRNKLNDVAITLGGPLLDALTEALEAAEPLIDGVADLAEGFTKLDKDTQRSIINMALFAGGISPIAKVIGSTTGLVGLFSKGLGGLFKKMAEFGAEKAAAKALVDVGIAATSASTSTGLLSTAVAGLGSLPFWGIIAGGAVVAGLAYFAHEASEAAARTREWGTEVSKAEASALSKFKSKVDETNQAMLEFEAGANSVTKVKDAFDDLASSIEVLANKKLSEQIDVARQLGLSETTINTLKSRSKQVVDNVNGMNEQVKAIYDRHNGDMSRLTLAEKELVLRNQREMVQAQLELMDFSAKEKKALTAALNDDLDALNLKQLDKALVNTNKMLEEENKSYKEKKAQLKEILAEFGNDTSKLNEQELAAYKETKAAMDSLEQEHILKKEAYQEQWLNIQRERVEKLRQSGRDEELIQLELAAITQQLASELGISYQAASELLKQSVDTSTEQLGILSNQTAEATAEVAAANAQWDSLFTNANPIENLKQLLSTAEGWNSFDIMLKTADVNPIGRAALAEMLVEGGKWQEMTLEQKLLVVDGKEAMLEIFNNQERLKEWQALTPEQKKLLAEDLTAHPTASATKALNDVKQRHPAPHILISPVYRKSFPLFPHF